MSDNQDGTAVRLTIGQRFDIARSIAKIGGTVEMIQQAAGITRLQAVEFWNKAHPGDLSHSEGLRKGQKQQ